MYRSVIQSALAADVESETYVEWVVERFGIERGRTRVIPNGVHTKTFCPGAGSLDRNISLDRHESLIGYVGALSRVRRVDSLLRAFAAIDDGDRTGLVLIGSGADEESLRHEARSLGVEQRVHFIGSVPYADVPTWMRRLDVAVDPTAVRMRTRRGVLTASFSQKIGQYLASGVPVVAWRCADTCFLDRDGIGRTARYPDEEDLAEAMRTLIAAVRQGKEELMWRARRSAETMFDSQLLADRRVAWWKQILARNSEGPRWTAG